MNRLHFSILCTCNFCLMTDVMYGLMREIIQWNPLFADIISICNLLCVVCQCIYIYIYTIYIYIHTYIPPPRQRARSVPLWYTMSATMILHRFGPQEHADCPTFCSPSRDRKVSANLSETSRPNGWSYMKSCSAQKPKILVSWPNTRPPS